MSQYQRFTPRGDRPPIVVDPDGDTWLWTDADKRGKPGYQYAGGATMSLSAFGIGPAYTRDYVEGGHYRVAPRPGGAQ